MPKSKNSKNNPESRLTKNDLRLKLQELKERAEKLQLQFRFHNGIFHIGDKVFARDGNGGAKYIEAYLEKLEK